MTFNCPPSAYFIFLVGSSAVGKTNILNAFPNTTEHPEFEDPFSIVKIDMSVRKIREQLGNPKWNDLLNDPELAIKHQEYVRDVFKQRIEDTYKNSKANTIYIFERSEFDVCGYSHAFNVKVFPEPQNYPNSLWFYREIDRRLPYAIEDARPPEIVRNICDAVLFTKVNEAKSNKFSIFNSTAFEPEYACNNILRTWRYFEGKK